MFDQREYRPFAIKIGLVWAEFASVAVIERFPLVAVVGRSPYAPMGEIGDHEDDGVGHQQRYRYENTKTRTCANIAQMPNDHRDATIRKEASRAKQQIPWACGEAVAGQRQHASHQQYESACADEPWRRFSRFLFQFANEEKSDKRRGVDERQDDDIDVQIYPFQVKLRFK